MVHTHTHTALTPTVCTRTSLLSLNYTQARFYLNPLPCLTIRKGRQRQRQRQRQAQTHTHTHTYKYSAALIPPTWGLPKQAISLTPTILGW